MGRSTTFAALGADGSEPEIDNANRRPKTRPLTSGEGHCAGNRNDHTPHARQATAEKVGPDNDGHLG